MGVGGKELCREQLRRVGARSSVLRACAELPPGRHSALPGHRGLLDIVEGKAMIPTSSGDTSE